MLHLHAVHLVQVTSTVHAYMAQNGTAFLGLHVPDVDALMGSRSLFQARDKATKSEAVQGPAVARLGAKRVRVAGGVLLMASTVAGTDLD
jgi:hypothetical protein